MIDPSIPTHTILEQDQPLSQSLLWQLQRQFFAQQGINAWNHGTVPHYVTSNPFIAHAYARVAFGFLRDWQHSIDATQPVYILELGAGSGRFAYHFLKKFWGFFSKSSLRHLRVQYILSDFSESNLRYWRSHPFLQPYFQKGLLDLAHFDAQQNQALHLQFANQSHIHLKNPLIVLANYFFDCLPQDVFTLQEHQLYASLVNLTLPGYLGSATSTSNRLAAPDLIHQITVSYTDHPISANYYTDPACNQLLADYQQQLTDTTVLLPIVGLNCLHNLRQLSQDRLLVLSGDKGYSQLADLQHRSKPDMVFHGNCFSLMVNYHAIGQYAINQGGQALHAPHYHASLNISAFLFGHPLTRYAETRHAYQDAIVNYSPDDFFSLKKAIEACNDRLTLAQILAFLRLSGWDAAIFWSFLPALKYQIESATNSHRQDLTQAMQNIWDTYYPIGESQDLALQLGELLLQLQNYRTAAWYLQQSLKLHGIQIQTLYLLGQCYVHLNEATAALYCLDEALKRDPGFTAAQQLRQQMN